MTLDPKTGNIIARPTTTYWQSTIESVAVPVVFIYNLTSPILNYSMSAAFAVQDYALNFFRSSKNEQSSTIPIPPKSMEELHSTKSLQGDSLTKQLQRDEKTISITVCGEKQESLVDLQKSLKALVQTSKKSTQEKHPMERILRICQQSIFQPGFLALKEKFNSSHIIIQEATIPLNIKFEKNADEIEAHGQFGVRMYETTDFDMIDQVNPRIYYLKFSISDVFSNVMKCRLEEAPALEIKKKQ